MFSLAGIQSDSLHHDRHHLDGIIGFLSERNPFDFLDSAALHTVFLFYESIHIYDYLPEFGMILSEITISDLEA